MKKLLFTKIEFGLQDGNVDNCLNFDDLFQNLWHWYVEESFNDLLYNSSSFVVRVEFVLRVRFA